MAARERMLLLLIALAMALVAPVGAQADSASSLEVVGGAEPSDAGLIRNVVQPEFELAFPQYILKYVASAANTAVANAEAGAGGPSVLLLDSPALESPFVAGGYSYNGQPGNAVFTEDFVLAGTMGDPAGVMASAPHDVAQAFADVAVAGVAGTATFISRGGTNTAPASTIEEHSIWSLVDKAGLAPAGVVLCTVSEADGGGMTPVNPNVQTASGMPCPDNGTVSGGDLPSWYETKSVNEEAEMTGANACVSTSNGATHCYVLTDRGTFDYLASRAGPENMIPNLTILDRDNAASATGGAEALVKYFHAYVINPAESGEQLPDRTRGRTVRGHRLTLRERLVIECFCGRRWERKCHRGSAQCGAWFPEARGPDRNRGERLLARLAAGRLGPHQRGRPIHAHIHATGERLLRGRARSDLTGLARRYRTTLQRSPLTGCLGTILSDRQHDPSCGEEHQCSDRDPEGIQAGSDPVQARDYPRRVA